jgi:hypothetical protein
VEAPEPPEHLPLPCWRGVSLDGVTLVRTVAEARRVAAQMERVSLGNPRVVHAWDTEVVGGVEGECERLGSAVAVPPVRALR